MNSAKPLSRLLAVALVGLHGGAVAAAPQTPIDEDIGALLGEGVSELAIETNHAFAWSPDYGFVPIQLPKATDPLSQEILVGLAGTAVSGAGFTWSPELGLVPVNAGLQDSAAMMHSLWSPSGNALRTVVWNAENLQTLVDQIAPPSGVVISSVQDIAPNGTVLGRALVGDSETPRYFVWRAGSEFTLVDDDPDMMITSLSTVSDTGYIIGQIQDSDGVPMAAVVLPDGTVRALPGADSPEAVSMGVNSAGHVVGVTADLPSTGLFWGSDGQPVKLVDHLSSPLPAGFNLLGATDINDAGEIVATSTSATGSVYLITLTPDSESAGSYVPRVIGEIFPAEADQASSAPRIYLSEDGGIVGDCGLGALDCPTGEFAFAGLDPSITNLGTPTGNGPTPFLALRSSLRASLAASTGPGAGSVQAVTSSFGSVPDNFDRSRPGFGDPTFPTLSAAAPPASAPVASAVPLPAAGFLMFLGLFLMRCSTRITRAFR